MILLPRPYPDEVLGSVLARGARQLGLSWARTLALATGRSASSAPFLMPFALPRLATCTGTDPECLLEEHTLFPYATAFMPLDRRQAFKALALARGDDCGLDSLSHVVLGRTPYRRVCPQCLTDDLTARGETYWRRSHLLPGVHVCAKHATPLCHTHIPLQHGLRLGDARLPAEVELQPGTLPLSQELLESIALHSVRAMTRPAADRNWLERYWVSAFALGYRLRRRAVAAAILAADIYKFYGADFLDSVGAGLRVDQKSPWPALLVRPTYPTRLATPKHILMLTFLEHAPVAETLNLRLYKRPGPPRRDYLKVDAAALRRMRRYLLIHTRKGQRLTVRSLLEASGEQPCMKRFPERFPRSLRFLRRFRRSRHAARRIRNR